MKKEAQKRLHEKIGWFLYNQFDSLTGKNYDKTIYANYKQLQI